MQYQIEFTKKAQKDIRRIPQKNLSLIVKAIDSLAVDPMPTGCKALKGELGGFHRIRVGSYRVIYEIQEMAIKILVLRIAPRGSVYQP